MPRVGLTRATIAPPKPASANDHSEKTSSDLPIDRSHAAESVLEEIRKVGGRRQIEVVGLRVADENGHDCNNRVQRIRQRGEDGDCEHLAIVRGSSEHEGKAAPEQKREERIHSQNHHRAAHHEAFHESFGDGEHLRRSAGVALSSLSALRGWLLRTLVVSDSQPTC